MKHVSIIGAGAWGTALAFATLRAGQSVTLWIPPTEEGKPPSFPHPAVKDISSLPDCPPFEMTSDIAVALNGADLVLLVPAAQYMRKTCTLMKDSLSPSVPLVIASKGIEHTSSLLMSDVVKSFFPENPLLVLSGPSFAHDVVKNFPTRVALAGETLALSTATAPLLTSRTFHLVPSDDIIGAEIAGSLKNVVAIACGIVEGHGLGDNTRAAVLAQGLLEIAHLGQAMGGKLETFLGLAGVGDITLTSFSSQSRNYSFGLTLGKGTPLKELLASKTTLTEGLHTTFGAMALAQKHAIPMPLASAVHRFLHEHGTLETVLTQLLFPGEA